MSSRTKLLYIAGYGRSGTTIVACILGQVDGFVNIGEARYVWDRGLVRNWYCGCGKRFRDCGFWGEVFKRAYGGFDRVNPQQMIPYLTPWSRALQSHRLRRNDGAPAAEVASVGEFVARLEALYRSVREVTGCTVVIDESKWPDYGQILSDIPSLDVHFLRMRRDPKAVAYSWKTPRKFEPDPLSDIYTPAHAPLRTALEWLVWNLAVGFYCGRRTDPGMEMSLESFMAKPEAELMSILRFLVSEHARLPLDDHQTADLTENHAVSGHPVRFARGKVRLELDTRWQTELSWFEKSLVDILTRPLALRWGYQGPADSRGGNVTKVKRSLKGADRGTGIT